MKFDQEQMDAVTELAKKTLHEFVKSDDFTGAIKEATNSAASDEATKIVNKAITSKFKSFGDKFESRVAELIKEAVSVRQDDDPADDPKGGGDEAKILKSPAFRKLTKEHETLKGEVQAERAKSQEIEVSAFHKERDADLKTLATILKAVDPDVVVDALRARVSRDDSGDLVVVTKDKEGVETIQTTQEHVEAYLKARSFLVKASGGGGAGSGEGQGGGAGDGGGEEVNKGTFATQETYMAARAKGLIKGVPAAPDNK